MLNTFEFEGGKRLLRQSLPVADRIARVKKWAHARKIPVIYVNDNFGKWHADWNRIYESCTEENRPGKAVAEKIKPDADDYFVLKPKHSGFYSTCLDVLLTDLGVTELVVTGVAADICVLFTVHDAHIREYDVTVLSDCVAAETPKRKQVALDQVKKVFKAHVCRSGSWR